MAKRKPKNSSQALATNGDDVSTGSGRTDGIGILKTRSHREGTVAWLADVLVQQGSEKAREALQEALRDDVALSNRDYKVLTPDDGKRVFRKDAKDDEKVVFTEFSPPGQWTPPYSLLKVTFHADGTRDRLISHSGEEILLPISGQLDYVFMRKWESGLKRQLLSETNSGPELLHETKGGPISVGEVIRIQPSVPHYTWAFGNAAAEAWMAIRNMAGNLGSIRGGKRDGVASHHHRYAYFEEEHPELYPMYAWAVSERVAYFRSAADMDLFSLADRLGIDRAQISRIENAGTNLGLLRLKLIGEELGFDALEGLTENLWVFRKDTLPHPDNGKDLQLSNELACDLDWVPQLSSRHLKLKKNQTWLRKEDPLYSKEGSEISSRERRTPIASISTWLVLKGLVALRTDEKVPLRFLSEGSVFHVRSPEHVIEITAHVPAELVRFQCYVLKSYFPNRE